MPRIFGGFTSTHTARMTRKKKSQMRTTRKTPSVLARFELLRTVRSNTGD